jgi:hypothetical protein
VRVLRWNADPKTGGTLQIPTPEELETGQFYRDIHEYREHRALGTPREFVQRSGKLDRGVMRLAAPAFGAAQRPGLGTLLSFSSRTAASVEPRSLAFSYQSLAILMSAISAIAGTEAVVAPTCAFCCWRIVGS